MTVRPVNAKCNNIDDVNIVFVKGFKGIPKGYYQLSVEYDAVYDLAGDGNYEITRAEPYFYLRQGRTCIHVPENSDLANKVAKVW